MNKNNTDHKVQSSKLILKLSGIVFLIFIFYLIYRIVKMTFCVPILTMCIPDEMGKCPPPIETPYFCNFLR